MSKLTILLLSSFAAALTVPMHEAKACSPESCRQARFAVQTMPASAPAIPFQADSTPAGGAAEVSVTKNGPARVVVTGTLQGSGASQAFVPSQPLEAGEYTIEYRRACNAPTGEGPTYAETGFTVTDAVALPTVAGTLAVKATSRESLRVSTSAGSCSTEVDAAIVDLDLTLDAALAPYRDVISYETLVDGQRWTGTAAGPREGEQRYRTHVRLFASCGDRSANPGHDFGMQEGSHLVQIVPTLVGSTQAITPAQIQVTVSCDTDNGEVVQPPPTGTGSSSGGTGNASSSGGGGSSGAVDDNADPQDQPVAGNGCSMHTGALSANVGALVAVGALVLARRRRPRA